MDDLKFVLEVPEVIRERHGNLDLYRPSDAGQAPVVVLVHGGPIPPGKDMRESTLFAGYAALLAQRGIAAVMFTHRLHSPGDYPIADADVVAAVEQARKLPGIDPDFVALWFFSGGGLLSADWLANPPSWLSCVALTYPVLDAEDSWGVDQRFRPVEALSKVGDLPILLTRVGRESAQFAPGVHRFVATAQTRQVSLEVIEVPHGQHAFDLLDHTEESRAAVRRSIEWTSSTLLRAAAHR